MASRQKAAFEWYKEHFDELYSQYGTGHIIISTRKKIIDIAPTFDKAYHIAITRSRPGKFIIQELGPDKEKIFEPKIIIPVLGPSEPERNAQWYDFQWFKRHYKRLYRQYGHVHLIVSNKQILGFKDSNVEAYHYAIDELKLIPGEFIIQEVDEKWPEPAVIL